MSHTAIPLDRPAAWCGTTLLVTDEDGRCDPAAPLTGLWVRETRHLCRLALEIDGERPWCCERSRPDPTRLAFVYVHPEMTSFGGGGSGMADDVVQTDEHGIPYRSLDVRLVYEVEPHRLVVRIEIANRSRRTVAPELALAVDGDYADLLEAVEDRRQQEAPVVAEGLAAGLRLRYEHPRLAFTTTIEGDAPGAPGYGERRWATRVELAPQSRVGLVVRVEAHDPDAPLDEAGRAARLAHHRRWRDGLTAVVVHGNATAQRILDRNAEDLASFAALEGAPDEWLAQQAGVPLYPAFFGRDALTAGWQAALLDGGEMLDAALVRLGRLQSDRTFDWRDEEPGRLPYQVRSGPLARLGHNPFAAYYADFATPLMYVIALANLWAWTGDRWRVARHWETAGRVLAWAERFGDRDGDGYLEYLTRSPAGAKNQGWKDSGDAIVDADGEPVPAPIATCELQAYWYCAQQLMALLCLVMGEPRRALRLRRGARRLRERFQRDFWDAAEGCYGLALGPDKRLVRSATSNVGHCLAAGIVPRERVPAVVTRLFAPDLFSGWGIRTLSADHPAYTPLGYHLGTVWPVENATICFGLRRFGQPAAALRLARALFELAALYPGDRMPEAVGGYARDEHPTPGAYPRSNSPQAWNASALPLVLQALLGIFPYGAWRLLVVDPLLPEWLPEVELRGLRVGGTRASLRFWRDGRGRTTFRVLEKDGPLHVVRQPPPEAGAGVLPRLGAALRPRHPRRPHAAPRAEV